MSGVLALEAGSQFFLPNFFRGPAPCNATTFLPPVNKVNSLLNYLFLISTIRNKNKEFQDESSEQSEKMRCLKQGLHFAALKYLGLVSLNIMALQKSNISIQEEWTKADAVCIDIDSTAITEESTDELIKFLGKWNETAPYRPGLKHDILKIHEMFKKTLEIVKPSVSNITNFLKQHRFTLTPGVKDLVNILKSRNISVFLISAGIDGLTEPIAKELGVPLDRLLTIPLEFYFHGDYAGFNENIPIAQARGKSVVIKHLKKIYGFKKVVMIGDGPMDVLAKPSADIVIGFGGNIVKNIVKQKADWFVMSMQKLIDSLKANKKKIEN